jgi:hypothetical protein
MNGIFRSGRSKRAASATDLAPVEPGQPDVRDQKVDALLRLQYPQAGWTVSGFHGRVAELVQHIDDQ